MKKSSHVNFTLTEFGIIERHTDNAFDILSTPKENLAK